VKAKIHLFLLIIVRKKYLVNLKRQIVINGAFITEDADKNYFQNRAFLYGDSIFETIRVNNRNILYFEEHLLRLISGMTVLKYHIPDKFTIFKDKLKDEILSLLNRNKIFKSARVRITVFRKSGGFYTPKTNEIDYLISASQLDNEKFVLNTDGLQVSVYHELKKTINLFSPYKTGNLLLYILAGVYKNEIAAGDCLILNEKNQIIEAVSSNLFLVKNKTLITPPVSDGCINGIMRNEIIALAKLQEIPCIEQSISEPDLFRAEELFLTNSISGIEWVVAYKDKRYYKRLSEIFIHRLNAVTD